MSEEEFIISSNDEDENGDMEVDDDMMDDEENEADTSPEGKYENAKNNLGINDEGALAEFQELSNNDNVPIQIRSKSICQTLKLLGNLDNLDEIKATLQKFEQLSKEGNVPKNRFSKTIKTLITNAMHSEEIYSGVLDAVTDSVDKTAHLQLFLEIKLSQISQKLRKGDINAAKVLIKEAEQYIPIPPEPEDQEMCRTAIKLLTTRIEVASMEGDDDAQIADHNIIQSIPNVVMPSMRAAGLDKKAEGIMELREGNYEHAKMILYESFKLFNDAGDFRRCEVLPLYTLAIMLTKDTKVDAYLSPELAVLMNHPLVAPLRQIYDAYLKSDIVTFLAKRGEAEKVLAKPQYIEALDNVRRFVLKNCIAKFCSAYSAVRIPYVASELKSDEAEVRRFIVDLILEKRLNMLIDEPNDTLIKPKKRQDVGIIEPIEPLISTLEVMTATYLKD